MSISDFEKQKEFLIHKIRMEIMEGKDLESLFNLLNKIIARNSVTSNSGPKTTKKAKDAKNYLPPAYYSRTRVPAIISLESDKNITHEDALNQINNMLDLWK